MKNDQGRLWLSTLLLLYLIGRILQLFAGRVPNLIIVAFHVIPPALFAAIHGARIYRLRGILVFTGLCLGVATFFESASLRTGFPFGHDRFTDLMGPKISGLPVLLALAWVGMGYLSWVVSLALLGDENKPLSGRRIVLMPLVASFVMTAWDLSMEAVWADVDHGWMAAPTMECRSATSSAGSSPHTSSINSSRYISETERPSHRARVTGV